MLISSLFFYIEIILKITLQSDCVDFQWLDPVSLVLNENIIHLQCNFFPHEIVCQLNSYAFDFLSISILENLSPHFFIEPLPLTSFDVLIIDLELDFSDHHVIPLILLFFSYRLLQLFSFTHVTY